MAAASAIRIAFKCDEKPLRISTARFCNRGHVPTVLAHFVREIRQFWDVSYFSTARPKEVKFSDPDNPVLQHPTRLSLEIASAVST